MNLEASTTGTNSTAHSELRYYRPAVTRTENGHTVCVSRTQLLAVEKLSFSLIMLHKFFHMHSNFP